MGTVNEDIADALVDHRLALLRYEAGAVRDILATFEAWAAPTVRIAQRLASQAKRAAKGREDPLSPAQVQELEDARQQLRAGARATYDAMATEMRARLGEVAETEFAVIARTIRIALPATDPPDLLAVAEVPAVDFRLAIEQPIGGNVWTSRLAVDLVAAHDGLQSAIALALAEGQSIPRAAKVIEAATGIAERYKGRFTAIARTEIQRVANAAASETYRQNHDIIGAVQYLATLDSRTCPVCAPLHNQIFQLDAAGRVPELIPGRLYRAPPIHPRCRCFLSPVTKSYRDLGIDLDDPVEQDRMNGREAINMDFQSWLRRQPVATQDDVLGPARANLWRKHGLTLEQFSDRGRVLNLGELRARYPALPAL